MSVRILHDSEQGKAVLWDSVSEWAFGPVFGWGHHAAMPSHPIDRADGFVRWLSDYKGVRDPRGLHATVLEALHRQWEKYEQECTCPVSLRERGEHSRACPCAVKRTVFEVTIEGDSKTCDICGKPVTGTGTVDMIRGMGGHAACLRQGG